MTVIVPADPFETSAALRAAAAFEGPVFLRISRTPVPELHDAAFQFQIGPAEWMRRGSHLTLIANGTMTPRALTAALLLEGDGVSAGVLNISTVKPLDRRAVAEAASIGPILTVEEHTTLGGLGGAVAEAVVTSHPVRMGMLGFPGVLAPIGTPEQIFESLGLTPAGIRQAAVQLLEECGIGSREVRSCH
jgi:transketolase